MRVVIAGGTGFLGRHVAEALRAAGHSVVLLARGTRPAGPGAGVEIVQADAASGPLPPEALRGADAVVNLIGIKREDAGQTFERVHVGASRHLLDAAGAAGARRFVQVSVVCSRPDPASAYHDTKWRAEELVRAGGLDATVLKPGVIYGPGDDMVTHLVKMIRFVPVFPVVGRGDSLLQPVHAADVAAAVVGALNNPGSVGKSYDVVGPERMTLRAVVETVARGVGLPVWVVGTPLWFQRAAVGAMNALFRNPLSTPAQLRMLIDGLYGDPGPARADLGVEPRPFTADVVGALAGPIPPLFGVSLRLVGRREHADELRRHRATAPGLLFLILLAFVLPHILAPRVPNVWYRAAVLNAVMLPVAILTVKLDWRGLLTPTARRVGAGASAALALYVVGWAVYRGLGAWAPALASQAAEVLAWNRQTSKWVGSALVAALIVPGDEIVWRGAVTLPLAARHGPWAGVLLGAVLFAATQLGTGPAVIPAAALGCGLIWGWLTEKTRSLVPTLVCHLLWDLAVFFWRPY